MGTIRGSRVALVATALLSLSLLPACGPQEAAPFRNGDYFEYQVADDAHKDLYVVEAGEDDTFKVMWHSAGSDPVELVIDQTGMVVETPSYPEGSLGRDLFLDRRIRLWLPTSKRASGEQVDFCDFLDQNVVVEQRQWRTWTVWVTRHSNAFGWQESYFDATTGFLVGSLAATGDEYVLSATSVEMAK